MNDFVSHGMVRLVWLLILLCHRIIWKGIKIWRTWKGLRSKCEGVSMYVMCVYPHNMCHDWCSCDHILGCWTNLSTYHGQKRSGWRRGVLQLMAPQKLFNNRYAQVQYLYTVTLLPLVVWTGILDHE